ncbi:MAG: hypothetical protein KDE04_12600 [Anaerolineales bacterium]|nr:hypothetical protein [Anaerolineales bacterium]
MSTLVKVKVQPGQTVSFPGLCVHSLETAVATLPIQARRGRVTRTISVPISLGSWQQLQAETAGEQRWRLLGRILAGFLALASLFLTPYFIPHLVPFWLRLLIGLALAGLLAFISLRLGDQLSLRQATAAKLAILNAVKMDQFSWRATTFRFSNDAYAEKFRQLNEPYLMDVDI